MRSLGLLAALVMACVASRADLNPEKLAAFTLKGSPLLKGLRKSEPDRYAYSPPRAEPPGTVAALEESWYHGATELHWTVSFYNSQEALNKGEGARHTGRSAPTPHSPPDHIEPVVLSWRPTDADQREQQRRLRGVTDPDEQMRIAGEFARRHPRTVAAGTTVGLYAIEVWVHQHNEMRRPGQPPWGEGLPEKRVIPLAKAVTEELVRRARRAGAVASPGDHGAPGALRSQHDRP